MLDLLSSNAFVAGLVAWIAYLVTGGIYRLYFHPLANFPGPKIAALTGWYECYHDLFRHGMLIWKLQELHDQYGPIIRINPYELHIRDSEYYDELYAPAAKRKDKYAGWVVLAGTPLASFATVPHNLHRIRRAALNPFFSKRSISKVEPLIMDKVQRLCARFDEEIKNKRPIRLDAAYMALTMDITTEYAYGESYDYLSEDDYKLQWKEIIVGGVANGVMLRQFPWALPILNAIPLPILHKLDPHAAALMEWGLVVKKKVEEMMERHRSGKKKEGTVFSTILDSDLPEAEKTAERLKDEGQSLVGAGSETTARSLSLVTFYLLRDKSILRRLRGELRTVDIDDPTDLLSRLEKLPYLTAIVQEGIRLNHGVTTRLPRISHEPIRYKDWEIPAGTPVSESNYFVHMDEEIFPEPREFKPERWIKAQEDGFRLDRYLVSFSKGSRQCVGIKYVPHPNYLATQVANIPFEMENYETTLDDVEVARDFFVGVPKLDSKGIRGVITGRAE
ncbi:hypothetical protein FQN54_006123 [Arachnomyces sp. PD_36]|nr:hypothetical protein FQN54_006123 [Arachnomyces sp. PD_36]